MDRFFLKLRGKFGGESIPMRATLRRIVQLKREQRPTMIGFISDQRPSGRILHHWTDFLGQDTPYVVGGETVGNHVGAKFVYLDVEKTSRGHYRMTFLPVVPDSSDNGPDPYTREFMKMLEKTIYRAPAYWLWSHRRWSRHR